MLEESSVIKIIANGENTFSNNMVESSFDFFKNDFMAGKMPKTRADLYCNTESFVEYNNFDWFPIEFHGLSPNEVLQGEIPDKNRCSEQIKQAKQDRLFENQSFDSQF